MRTPTLPEPLPVPVVDNHTHLDITRDGDEPADLDAVLREAASVGVDRVVQIGCDLPSARLTVELVDRYAGVLGGVALHPNEAPRLAASGSLETAYREVEQLAAHPRIRVVGETGLDFHRTGPEGRGVQEESFRWHVRLARRLGRVLQVHDRDAHGEVLRVLGEEGAGERTVLHCFCGDAELARECVDRGYSLSFAGTVTFRNAAALREALAVVPLDRVLVETDAPYLAPHPWRGARNSPALVPLTVRTMAEVLDVTVPTLCGALDENAERLYGPW